MAMHRSNLVVALALAAAFSPTPSLAQLRALGDLTPGSADSFGLGLGQDMGLTHEAGNFLFRNGASCSLYMTDGSTTPLPAFDYCANFNVQQASTVMSQNDGRTLIHAFRNSPTSGYRLLTSNGTLAGTSELDFGGHISVHKVYPWPAFPGWVLLAVEKAGGVHEAWLSDGTQANTRLLIATGITPQFASMQDRRLVILGNGVWTLTSTTATPTQLPPAITNARLFANENPKPAGRLYFTASALGFGNELWVTDLTAAGTLRLTDLNEGGGDTTFLYGRSMLQDGGHHFIYQDRLYYSDGTEVGTVQVSPVMTVSIPPLLRLDNGVVIGTVLTNDGRRLFKHRPTTPASFATFTGVLGNTTQASLFNFAITWPNEALYAVSPIAFANIQQVVPAAAPTDAALGALIAGQRNGQELNRYLGDTLLDSDGNRSRLWRRGETTPPPEHVLSMSFYMSHTTYVGGSVMFGAWETPVAGREVHVWDLAPHGVPICNFPNKKVPDNSPAGRSDSLFLRADGLAASDRLLDLRVHLDLPHSYVGDLIVDLLHVPSGRTARLLDRPGHPTVVNGCSGNDLDVIIDDASALSTESCATGSGANAFPSFERLGSFAPTTPLSAFIGADPVGEWRLTVSDNIGSDVGGITGWCLDMTLGPESVDLFKDGFETAP